MAPDPQEETPLEHPEPKHPKPADAPDGDPEGPPGCRF